MLNDLLRAAFEHGIGFGAHSAYDMPREGETDEAFARWLDEHAGIIAVTIGRIEAEGITRLNTSRQLHGRPAISGETSGPIGGYRGRLQL